MASHIARRAYRTERRRASRALPNLEIQGVDLSSGTAVRLRDFSARSFAVESQDPMTDKRTREFEFPLGLGKIAFKGVPKRRERIKSANGQPCYLVAFEFSWKTPASREAVAQFVRNVRGEVA
jgi:hypothetical protein